MNKKLKGKAVCPYCLTAFDPNEGHDCYAPYTPPEEPREDSVAY